jgi:molecular chaperone IbpA
MPNKALSIFNQLRPITVGYDDVFDHFESMFDEFGSMPRISQPSFPFYNIVKQDKNKYDIQIALAGYNKKDIEVTLEEGILKVSSKKEEKEDTKDGEIIHKGITKNYFSKSFTVAEDVEINGAELKDGLLTISMERIIPEHKKARTINIK